MPGVFYGEDQVFAPPFVESLECGPLAVLPRGPFCEGSSWVSLALRAVVELKCLQVNSNPGFSYYHFLNTGYF